MTEKQLWERMRRRLIDRTLQMARIETSTHLGVSDVEYVGDAAHGWVELKVAKATITLKPLRFQEEFKISQQAWLLGHHKPEIGLRSYLLIAVVQAYATREWILSTPYNACRSYRDKSPWGEWHQRFTRMEDVLTCINQGAME